MEYDVVVVGGGPAGLAAAIRLRQLAAERGKEVSVCLLEKGLRDRRAYPLRRGHGSARDGRALPRLESARRPAEYAVTEDRFMFLTQTGALRTPGWMLPACFQNHGNYVISLANVARWLGQQAEALGVEIFPGFAAAEVLYNGDGSVKGVATGDMGIGRDGKKTDAYQEGMELHAKYTFFAEGCAANLGKAARGEIRAEERRRPAGLRPRREGALGNRAGQAQGRARRAYRRLAPRARHLRRLVPVPPRKQPGRRRVRRRAGLYQSLPRPLRGIPALQDPSGDPRVLRRRQAHCLRRARDHRGRPPVAAEGDFPRRRAHRRRRGLPERVAHQGQPLRDQVRHDGRRCGFRRSAGRPLEGRARGLPGSVPPVVALRRALPRAQFQAVDVQGPLQPAR